MPKKLPSTRSSRAFVPQCDPSAFTTHEWHQLISWGQTLQDVESGALQSTDPRIRHFVAFCLGREEATYWYEHLWQKYRSLSARVTPITASAPAPPERTNKQTITTGTSRPRQPSDWARKIDEMLRGYAWLRSREYEFLQSVLEQIRSKKRRKPTLRQADTIDETYSRFQQRQNPTFFRGGGCSPK